MNDVPPDWIERIEETGERVGAPELVTRFRWRAERRRRRLEATRRVPFYRWEVVRERVKVSCVYADRWAVVAMQNRIAPA